MPLYEFVLRRAGFADEVRLTDHAGVDVEDTIFLGHHQCVVTSVREKSTNPLVTERVICELAAETSSLPRAGSPLQPLLQRQSLLGVALEKFDAAAFVFDAKGALQVVNDAALKMTGYTWPELRAIDSAELMQQPADGPRTMVGVVDGSIRSGTGAIRRKDGSLLDVTFRVGATAMAAGVFYLSLCWPVLPR